MIRQICLSCYKMTELADDAAGKQVTCPNCGKPMDVPAKYAPGVVPGGGVASVSPPPPPPPVVAPEPPPGLTPPPGLVVPSQSPPPMPGEYAGGVGFTLNPAWLAWVPLGCLTAVFILSFFSWARLAPGGYTVITQSGWDSFFGWHSDTVPELTDWTNLEASFRDGRLRSDLFIIPYMLLLIPTIGLVALERLFKPGSTKLPGPLLWVPQIWPYFLYLLAGLSVLLLILVGIASLRGFGIERGVADLAQAKFQEQLDKNPPSAELKKLNIQIGQEAARFAPRQSGWVNLLLFLHVLAVLALLARIWLNTRPTMPHPRVGVQW